MRHGFSLHLIVFTATGGVALAQGQTPSITGLQNNYSYTVPGSPNYGIAPGSLFIVTGVNLSNASNGLQPFPIPTLLDGVSVSITVAGTTTHAPLYYAFPTQLGAVTWTGGAPNTAVVISGQSAAVLGSFNITQSFFCLAPAAAQKFTVPASILLSLPSTPTSPIVSQAYLGIGNSSNPITFSASGIDLGFAAALIFDYTGLGTGFYYQ
jgi:uncharacterized protein (TIGR03437 family)